MAISNNITTILNLIAIMASIPILTSAIWLASKPDSHCIHWLRWPIVFLGLLFLFVSLAGFVGSYWNKPTLLSLHICFAAILIVLLISLLILSFVVTRESGEYSVAGRGFSEYRLGGFSGWLREHVTGDAENWRRIRVCLLENRVCEKLGRRYFVSADQFFASRISPLQSGCCKPPSVCEYQYVNPTMWVNSVNPIADPDCALWDNNPTQLCYNCDSCKAGLLGNLRKEWTKANVILIVVIVVLIFVYLIACRALKNAQSQGSRK